MEVSESAILNHGGAAGWANAARLPRTDATIGRMIVVYRACLEPESGRHIVKS